METRVRVMKQENIDVVCDTTIETSIDIDHDGKCNIDMVMPVISIPGAWNTRENTRAVYPDAVLSSQSQIHNLLANLANAEDNVSGKHFIITRHAKEYLAIFNAEDKTRTDELVKKTQIFFTSLKTTPFKSLSPDYLMSTVSNENKAECEELSTFQQETLLWFRKLKDDEVFRKTKDRYALDAFNSRVASPEIKVFIVRDKKNNQLLGTLTLNLHTNLDAPESSRFGYLSDLFVAEGCDNSAFISNLINGIFSQIQTSHPNLEILVGMTASTDQTIPIVRCFEYAKKDDLIQPLTRAKQEELGIVTHFTPLTSENKDKKHPSPPPPGTLSKLSLVTGKRKEPSEATTTHEHKQTPLQTI